jgi:hypothetical protein
MIEIVARTKRILFNTPFRNVVYLGLARGVVATSGSASYTQARADPSPATVRGLTNGRLSRDKHLPY